MQQPVPRGSSISGAAERRPRVVATLSAGAPQAAQPLIHLGVVAEDHPSPAAPECTIGFCQPEGTRWTPVGRIDLQAASAARVLMAGLSAQAMIRVRDSQVQIGDPVLVLGTDPWSLLLVQWGRLQGGSPLVFVWRGQRGLGASASAIAVDAELQDPSPGDLARAVRATHRSAGFAVAFDAIGSEGSVAQALSALRDGGRYISAGLQPQPHVSLNAYPDLHRRDLEIVAVHPASGDDVAALFRFSLEHADSGRLQLETLLREGCGWTVTSEDAARKDG